MSSDKGEFKAARLVDAAKPDQHVLAVLLFGSHARGEEGATSDLDICLVLQPGRYSDLELSQKRAEYLQSFDLDITGLPTAAALHPKESVQRGCRPLLSR